ncbi:MAG: DUF4157 domain-containing protein [Nitrolancea sp.]
MHKKVRRRQTHAQHQPAISDSVDLSTNPFPGPDIPESQRDAALPDTSSPVDYRLDQIAITAGADRSPPDHESERDADSPLQRALDESSPGEPLDREARQALEPGFGYDLSTIRIHADGEADRLTSSVDALAFTSGEDIFFSRGAYQPSSPRGLHLLAHEATHVGQQQAGDVPGTLHESGVRISGPSDDFERTAHRTADRLLAQAGPGMSMHGAETEASIQGQEPTSHTDAIPRSADSTAVTIQRVPSGSAAYVGGGTDETQKVETYLPNREGGNVAIGEAGFSRAMLMQTPADAAALGDMSVVRELQVKNVVPDLTALERGKKQRGDDIARMQDVMDAPWYEENHFTRELARDGKDWATSHLEKITKDGDTEQQKFQSFNNWVPQANGFYTSITRLQAEMNMLGITDIEEMATSLVQGLGSAETAEGGRASGAVAVGERYINAQTGNDRRDARGRGTRSPQPTAPLPVPPVDDTATQAATDANQAFSVMNTKYLGMQRNFHQQRRAEINAEGDDARSRLSEINDVKQFIANVGTTIDLAASVVNGAPAAIANATTTVQRAGAQYGAIRNRRAMMRGESARWNPTYTTVDDKGNMVVRNMQTGMDLDPSIEPGEEGRHRESPGGDGGVHLPTGVGDLLNTIADFAYADEVRELNKVLASVEARCTAEDVASAFLETLQHVREYRDALNDYAIKAFHLQQRLAERRRQYLEFGEQLDSFARDDARSRLAGEAPDQGGHGRPPGERYATIMALTGQVREAVVIGSAALSSDNIDTDSEIRFWAGQIRDHRTSLAGLSGAGAQHTIDWLRWPEAEQTQIEALFHEISTFRARATMLIDILAPVDAAADQVIRALHPGGGSGAY